MLPFVSNSSCQPSQAEHTLSTTRRHAFILSNPLWPRFIQVSPLIFNIIIQQLQVKVNLEHETPILQVLLVFFRVVIFLCQLITHNIQQMTKITWPIQSNSQSWSRRKNDWYTLTCVVHAISVVLVDCCKIFCIITLRKWRRKYIPVILTSFASPDCVQAMTRPNKFHVNKHDLAAFPCGVWYTSDKPLTTVHTGSHNAFEPGFTYSSNVSQSLQWDGVSIFVVLSFVMGKKCKILQPTIGPIQDIPHLFQWQETQILYH